MFSSNATVLIWHGMKKELQDILMDGECVFKLFYFDGIRRQMKMFTVQTLKIIQTMFALGYVSLQDNSKALL